MEDQDIPALLEECGGAAHPFDMMETLVLRVARRR